MENKKRSLELSDVSHIINCTGTQIKDLLGAKPRPHPGATEGTHLTGGRQEKRERHSKPGVAGVVVRVDQGHAVDDD